MTSRLSPLIKRLLPLYGASFFQSFVLWYAIEKLFMVSIGFNSTTIGLMIAVYSIMILLSETPSGILADRWSRKGVLIIASILLALSSLIGGLSTNIPMYLLCAALWGVYNAMASGTYQSVIYDTLLEEQGHAKNYKKLYGLSDVAGGAGLVVSSLAGGLVVVLLGQRAAFFLTIPALLISVILLWWFKEPRLHKAEVSEPIKQHVAQTFAAILKQPSLRPILLGIMLLSLTASTILEFSQLWYIAIAVPLIFYGPINAIVLLSFSLSGFFAKFATSLRANLIFLGLCIISMITLIISRNIIALVASFLLLSTSIFIVRITLEHQFHDYLPSKIRAGAASAISTLSRIIIIPFILFFGFAAEQYTVFNATYFMLFIFLFGVVASIIALRRPISKTTIVTN